MFSILIFLSITLPTPKVFLILFILSLSFSFKIFKKYEVTYFSNGLTMPRSTASSKVKPCIILSKRYLISFLLSKYLIGVAVRPIVIGMALIFSITYLFQTFAPALWNSSNIITSYALSIFFRFEYVVIVIRSLFSQ